jgi:hypothetical protein
MNLVESLVVGFVLFVLTSITAYIFKTRQLYVVARKLYGTSILSEQGSLSEVLIFNMGNLVEENIKVVLSPDIKCELIASSSADIKLSNDNIIIFDRLHSKSQVSLLLLVEKGILEDSILGVTSDAYKGKTIRQIGDVPPNFGQIAIFILGIIFFITALLYVPKVYKYYREIQIEHDYKTILDQKWKNISNYVSSDLAKSYSPQEFPIRYVDQKSTKDMIIFRFEALNKSAIPINIIMETNDELEIVNYNTDFLHYDLNKLVTFNRVDETVPPLSKKDILLKIRKTNQKNIQHIKLTIGFGDSYIHDIYIDVPVKNDL